MRILVGEGPAEQYQAYLMLENNRSVTETLFWELMEKPTHPAMTFQQIVTDLRVRSESELNDLNIDETQLLKLLQHHANRCRKIRAGKAVVRPWILHTKKSLSNDEVKKSVLKRGV